MIVIWVVRVEPCPPSPPPPPSLYHRHSGFHQCPVSFLAAVVAVVAVVAGVVSSWKELPGEGDHGDDDDDDDDDDDGGGLFLVSVHFRRLSGVVLTCR